MGKISVITVVKDDLKGLKRTAESVLNQSRARFEWIIVDGNSSDGTFDFLKTLPPKVSIYNLEPTGIYSAMNFAAERARGDWIWYLNAGDIFLQNDSVGKMLNLIENTKDAEMIASPVIHLSKGGFLFSQSHPKIGPNGAEVNHQGVAMKRNLFLSVGGFDPSLKLAADGKLLDITSSMVNFQLGQDFLVGFALGGESGINFRKTLEEISSYRVVASRADQFRLILKNQLRLRLLRWESSTHFSKFVIPYLKNRQNSELRDLGGRASFSKHFHEKTPIGTGLFSCCFQEN